MYHIQYRIGDRLWSIVPAYRPSSDPRINICEYKVQKFIVTGIHLYKNASGKLIISYSGDDYNYYPAENIYRTREAAQRAADIKTHVANNENL